jgi:hypothetical protein
VFLREIAERCYDPLSLRMTKRKTPGPGEHEHEAEAEADPGVAPGHHAADGPRVNGDRADAPTGVDGPRRDRGLPTRKPMARAVRLTLFEREVRERLSRAAMDVVFARAESISEGQCQSRGGREAYFGSTMLTIDLAALGDVLRDAGAPGTPERLAILMEADHEVPVRIRDIAAREATRIAVARLKDMKTHVSIRAQDGKVFIDVDVEASV